MSHPLDGARAKVARAQEHFDTFEREAEAFIRSDPYEVVCEVEPNGTQYVYRIRIRESPPIRLSICIGGALYNLRSSLDHVAWQLALLHGPPPPMTEFPVFSDRTAYLSESPRKLKGIGAQPQALIESLQPYHFPEPDGSLLWMLHRLSNIDKHRLLHLTGGAIGSSHFQIPPGAELMHRMFCAPFEDNAEFARFILPNPDTVVDMDVHPAFGIAFDKYPLNADGVFFVDEVLRAIMDFVSSVVPSFDPFFT
ncbi:MAG TPA: hypothetical protein VK988_05850 [Acidimicrobiales bacterium]|nr:hypothetical protein [Acidimicrobiales bacterium]